MVNLVNGATMSTDGSFARMSPDGLWVTGLTSFSDNMPTASVFRYSVATDQQYRLPLSVSGFSWAVSGDAKQFAVPTRVGDFCEGCSMRLLDVEREQTSSFSPGFNERFRTASLDGDSRFLAFEASHTVGNSVESIVLVTDLKQVFDRDHDTLDDRWETFFGLDPPERRWRRRARR